MATEIGIIKALVGTATATATDGTIRNLQVGDKVYQNDLITTGAAGAVEIEFADGSTMDMGRSSQAMLDLEVFDPSTATTETAETTETTDDIAAIQQALLEGEDPTVAGEATAAGAGAGGGSEGGHDFVVRDYLNPEVTPENGFDTTGPDNAFLQSEEELNEGKKGIHVLGGKIKNMHTFSLPIEKAERNIIEIRKEKTESIG